MISIVVAAGTGCAQTPTPGVEAVPLEVSGILVHRDVTQKDSPVIFSIAADEAPGRYFKNFLKHLPEVGQSKPFPARALRVSLAEPFLQEAVDLEDIGMIADRIVVLSEEHSKLYSETRVVADYSGIKGLRYVNKKHGLEGLAVRSQGPGAFRVAVLWEGGQRQKQVMQGPRIYMHDMTVQDFERNQTFQASEENGRLVSIQYADLLSLTGQEDGTTIRSPAMVWTQVGDEKWGFILILSVSDMQSYRKKWLARFDETGKPVGTAIPLDQLGMSQDLVSKNWEGMCWNADEKSLILVNDAKDGTILFAAARPAGW